MRSTAGSLHRLVTAMAVLVAVLATAGTAALAATPAAAAPVGPTSDAPVAPAVEATVANGDARVIAVTRAPGEQVAGDIVADLPAGSAKAVKAGRTPQVALTVDAAGLDALKASPDVERIVEDKPNRIDVAQWASAVGLPGTQAAGWSGVGRKVAILDTGVQADHPFLVGKVAAEACFSQSSGTDVISLCPGQVAEAHGAGAAAPCSGIPGCEHGTHIAGIAAGGPVSTPSDLVGVAPAASIIAVKVFTRVTSSSICGPIACLVAFDSDIVSALDWLVQRKQAADPMMANLDAVNLSLGGGLFTTSCDGINPTITSLVNSLRSLGVATVAASGNNGVRGSMASPACISTVVSVGATDGTGSLAGYSNLTAATTILAPGSSITSSVPGSGYDLLTGTSMATPMISGALADLRGKSPTLTVAQAVSLLRSTGDRIPTSVGVVPELELDNATADVPGTPTRDPGPPFGWVDDVSVRPGAVGVAGWAIDPDTAMPIAVHVYVDSTGSALVANDSRPDVHAAFGYGPNHGYSAVLSASAGAHTVCVYGINVGVGNNVLLGCRVVTVPSGTPIGNLDVVSTGPGSVSVAGWAIDPDTAAPIPVHVYVDGAGYALTADGFRSDIASFFGPYGGNHGFNGTFPAASGVHTVCAYGINTGLGANALLACRTVTVGASPFGSLDVAQRSGSTIVVAGWAIDPDTAAPIAVHVYVTAPGYSTAVALTADGSRSDVGSVFPLYGALHGFGASLTPASAAPAGATVCAYGINVGVGGNVLLGCKVVP